MRAVQSSRWVSTYQDAGIGQEPVILRLTIVLLHKPQISLQAKWAWTRDCEQAEIDYMQRTPFSLSIPSHGCVVVHAGLLPGLAIEQQQLLDLIEVSIVSMKQWIQQLVYNSLSGPSICCVESSLPRADSAVGTEIKISCFIMLSARIEVLQDQQLGSSTIQHLWSASCVCVLCSEALLNFISVPDNTSVCRSYIRISIALHCGNYLLRSRSFSWLVLLPNCLF